jgi:hypothetical protein
MLGQKFSGAEPFQSTSSDKGRDRRERLRFSLKGAPGFRSPLLSVYRDRIPDVTKRHADRKGTGRERAHLRGHTLTIPLPPTLSKRTVQLPTGASTGHGELGSMWLFAIERKRG